MCRVTTHINYDQEKLLHLSELGTRVDFDISELQATSQKAATRNSTGSQEGSAVSVEAWLDDADASRQRQANPPNRTPVKRTIIGY